MLTSSSNIDTKKQLPEITKRVISLSILLTMFLAISNAYLALKVGILASASIPAAIISMAILKRKNGASILENNLVQTAASAGEAIAGGIVYTAPALILIHFWSDFGYWENVAIALIGGMLGVLFSIPLRKTLVTQPQLQFPEGKAIAEVLRAGHAGKISFSDIFKGGLLGAFLEFVQTGLQVVSQQAGIWFKALNTVWGFGLGFSAPMFGVGYLVGFRLGVSLIIGALLCWLIGIPMTGLLNTKHLADANAAEIAQKLWSDNWRYIGVGAMLTAGLMTMGQLVKPFIVSIRDAWRSFKVSNHRRSLEPTEADIPLIYVFGGVLLCSIALIALFEWQLPIQQIGAPNQWAWPIILTSVLYVLIIGFIFCAITGYFSGLVGVTASPGSAIIIAGLLFAAIILRLVLGFSVGADIASSKLAAAAVTIFIGAIITGAAAIANDNIQDLKVGYILGATPWKQQLMLILGVIVAALIIPMVMQLLFKVYGIGDVLPGLNMDPTKALPAPPAAMMAAVTLGVFDYNLPWQLMGLGAAIIGCFGILNQLAFMHSKHLSLLGIAMGIYLPLATSTPLFLGGLVSYLAKYALMKQSLNSDIAQSKKRRAVLVACGLVSGAAVMNIVLAVPFILGQSPDVLAIMPEHLLPFAHLLGLIAGGAICIWLYRVVVK